MPVDQPGGSEGGVIVAVSFGYKGDVALRGASQGPELGLARFGAWTHRGAHRHRVPRDRLARRSTPLSRRTAPAGRQNHRTRPLAHRAQGQKPFRYAILHRLYRPNRRARRSCHARPLAHRERSPLDPRRRLQGRPVTPAQRTSGSKHGCRPALRNQPRQGGQRQTINQTAPKNSGMGPTLPSLNPRRNPPLTRIQSPAT